jgi:prepilin-type N-terminal cleavage/methylation domain-containing protein
MRGRRHRKCAGYTLAEMLIAVTLVAAASAVVVPMLGAPSASRVELAATELAEALRFARSEAERTRVPHGVRIDAGTERAQVFRLDTGTTPATALFTVRHPIHHGWYTLDFANDRPTRGVAITAATLSFSAACGESRDVVFDARGWPVCSQPPAVELSSATIDLGSGSVTRRVVVEAVTGRVVLQ